MTIIKTYIELDIIAENKDIIAENIDIIAENKEELQRTCWRNGRGCSRSTDRSGVGLTPERGVGHQVGW